MSICLKGLGRVLALACAVTAVSGPALAQELKISHQWKANTDARDKAARIFIEEVNKKDPSLKFRIYPSQSLGIKPVAQLDALQNGTLEMAIFPMSYAVGKAKEFSGVILPGTIPNLDFAMRLKKSSYYKRIQELSEKKWFPHHHMVVDAWRFCDKREDDYESGVCFGSKDACSRPHV